MVLLKLFTDLRDLLSSSFIFLMLRFKYGIEFVQYTNMVYVSEILIRTEIIWRWEVSTY